MNLDQLVSQRSSTGEVEYKINEMFQSIQGEGHHTGVPSVFIRLQGCPVACPWCDTQHTWAIDLSKENTSEQVFSESQESEHWFRATARSLLDLVISKGYSAKHIVLTGGEPAMYDLVPVTTLFIEQGFSVQIETSGTYPVSAHPKTWITVSPKINMRGGYEVLSDVLVCADEIKHPIAMERHVEELDELLKDVQLKPNCEICIQPISQQQRATELAIKVCIERNWRLSLQTHKFINIE